MRFLALHQIAGIQEISLDLGHNRSKQGFPNQPIGDSRGSQTLQDKQGIPDTTGDNRGSQTIQEKQGISDTTGDSTRFLITTGVGGSRHYRRGAGSLSLKEIAGVSDTTGDSRGLRHYRRLQRSLTLQEIVRVLDTTGDSRGP